MTSPFFRVGKCIKTKAALPFARADSVQLNCGQTAEKLPFLRLPNEPTLIPFLVPFLNLTTHPLARSTSPFSHVGKCIKTSASKWQLRPLKCASAALRERRLNLSDLGPFGPTHVPLAGFALKKGTGQRARKVGARRHLPFCQNKLVEGLVMD